MQKANSTTIWLQPPGELDLQPRQVDVWRISLDLAIASAKSIESHLSSDESQRAARFHFPEDRDRYIVAHGCLRNVLSRYLHSRPDQLIFATNEYGKPVLPDNKLEFNLSHSGDFALIALAWERQVGVDVERIRPDLSTEAIARRYFSQREVSELLALPPEQREIAFFRCWTRKEAYIKAKGLGLSLPLESFDVSLTPNEPAILHATRPDAKEASLWKLLSLEVDARYASAVAVESCQDLEFRLWDWNS
jgi:4'-phosphopantetheinyl transferase